MKNDKIKIIGLVIFLLILLVIGLTVDRESLFDPEKLKLLAESHPLSSILGFASLVILMHFLFIPMIPTSAVAGYLYGPTMGMVVALSTLILSLTSSFLLARRLGRPFIERAVSDENRIIRLARGVTSSHGFLTVIFFRLVPVLNFISVNVLFGVSRVKTSTYLMGSMLGMLPGVFLLSRVGGLIEDWGNPTLYIYIGAYVTLTLTAMWLSYEFKSRFS